MKIEAAKRLALHKEITSKVKVRAAVIPEIVEIFKEVGLKVKESREAFYKGKKTALVGDPMGTVDVVERLEKKGWQEKGSEHGRGLDVTLERKGTKIRVYDTGGNSDFNTRVYLL